MRGGSLIRCSNDNRRSTVFAGSARRGTQRDWAYEPEPGRGRDSCTGRRSGGPLASHLGRQEACGGGGDRGGGGACARRGAVYQPGALLSRWPNRSLHGCGDRGGREARGGRDEGPESAGERPWIRATARGGNRSRDRG